MEQKPILRDKEIEDLKKLFKENEVLFIKGASGVGKTTLIEYVLDIKYHSIKIHLYKDFTLVQLLEKSRIIISKTNIFRRIQNIFYFKKLNFKWSLDFSFFNKNSDNLNLKLKNNNKGIQLVNEDIDINLSVNNLSLTKKTSPEYFKKYFSLVKNDINCLLFENTELIEDEELYHLQNLLLEKPKKFKIIFEIGELKDTKIYVKLLRLLNNQNIPFIDYEIGNFNYKRSKEFYNFYKEKKNLTSFDFNKNDGIPLLILLFGGAFIPDKHDFSKSLNEYRNFNDELYLLLVILYGLKIDENTFLRYANKYDIPVNDLETFKNSNLIKLRDGQISFSHPLIQKFILDNKYQQIGEFIKKIFKNIDKKDFEYLYIKLKFLNRYNLEFEQNDINFLISHLTEKLEKFDFQTIISLLSHKNEFYDKLSYSNQNIIDLIELQTKLYNFRLENLDDSKFDIKTKIIAKLLIFQYQDHKDNFEDTEKEINLFKKELRENNIYINILDNDLIEYLTIILNGILISVKRALSKYDEAQEHWIEAIQCSKNNPEYKNIYNYLMNMYPFAYGIKETFDEQSTDFFEIAFIENKYIKAKRMHNINAINLYYKYENYSNMEYQLNITINFLKQISPLEISYTYNNLLVLYIVNKEFTKAENLINDIDKYFFETYDLISFYNNAIVLGIVNNNFEYSLKYYKKALELNFKDNSFDSKIHYNMGLFYKLQGDDINMENCFKKMTIDTNYDNGLIENKKEFIRNNNIDNTFIFNKDKKDIREHFIYWFQIIHFWDFDIPILNKKIIQYLLKE